LAQASATKFEMGAEHSCESLSPCLDFLHLLSAQSSSPRDWRETQAARAQDIAKRVQQELFCSQGEGVEIAIVVEMLSGRTVKIAMRDSAPLYLLHSALEDATQIPAGAQKLILHGEMLKAHLSTPLSLAGFSDGDTVTLAGGDLDFSGTWAYEDDAGSHDFFLCFERTEAGNLMAYFMRPGMQRTWRRHACNVDGPLVTIEASDASVYTGMMRSDGQLISGTWLTQKRMNCEVGVVKPGDTGCFMLRRVLHDA